MLCSILCGKSDYWVHCTCIAITRWSLKVKLVNKRSCVWPLYWIGICIIHTGTGTYNCSNNVIFKSNFNQFFDWLTGIFKLFLTIFEMVKIKWIFLNLWFLSFCLHFWFGGKKGKILNYYIKFRNFPKKILSFEILKNDGRYNI